MVASQKKYENNRTGAQGLTEQDKLDEQDALKGAERVFLFLSSKGWGSTFALRQVCERSKASRTQKETREGTRDQERDKNEKGYRCYRWIDTRAMELELEWRL